MEPSPYPAVVQEGETVIIDVNGDRQAFITVEKNSKVKLGQTFCSAASLIGCPYGAMFTLSADGRSLERTEHVPMSDWDVSDGPQFNKRSNAELKDAGVVNQGLSTADIEAMKAEGASGADIVAALAANSATFATKTEFSQEKYKKKKAKKYIQVATVRRPTAAAVCEAYFANTPAKTNYLRADTLALLLALANVGAHARVLVVENCGGLVSAAALERLGAGGAGCVVSGWAGGPGARRPALDIWRQFNFPGAQRDALRFAPLHELLREQQAELGGGEVGAAAEAAAAPVQQPEQQQEQQQQEAPAEAADVGAGSEAMEVQNGAPAPAEQQGAAPAAAAAEAAAEAGGGGSAAQAAAQQGRPPFNCCILAATNLNPLALVRHVLPLLAPSASLAVYCPWQHPLAEALDALRGQGEVTGLVLHEAWWRQMQVLPLRTHPNMNMHHGGGFILSGTVLATGAGQQ